MLKRDSFADLLAVAVATAKDHTVALRFRLAAIRVLAKVGPGTGGNALLTLLLPEEGAEVQSAAVKAVVELNDPKLASDMFADWSRYSRATRQQILSAKTTTALDREAVVQQFQPALKLPGDRSRGAEIFARNCLVCHALQGKGERVGADLSGLGSRPREALLVDILDPSRQVSPDFVSYTVVTTPGESLSGLIVAETGKSITVRRAGVPDEAILRKQIAEVRAEGKSLMPNGLEQGMTQQDVADLLEFLRQPDAALLP